MNNQTQTETNIVMKLVTALKIYVEADHCVDGKGEKCKSENPCTYCFAINVLNKLEQK